MVLCVWYTKDLKVIERFLGFINVSENQNADSLSSDIGFFLDKYNSSELPIIAQLYDGDDREAGWCTKENSGKTSIRYLHSLHGAQN